MGGGNAQKSKMAREKNLEKARQAGKGISNIVNRFDLGFERMDQMAHTDIFAD